LRLILVTGLFGCLQASPVAACTSSSDCITFDPCLTNPVCFLGTCYYQPVVCENRGPCIASRCDPNLGCVYEPVCPDDGVACNGVEYCVPTPGGPVCQRTTVSCGDANACTIDFCAEPGGCDHVSLDCNDGDACTYDSCAMATGCQHEAIVGCCRSNLDCPDQPCRTGRLCGASFCSGGTPRDCDDGDSTTLDTCNPATGCVHTPTTATTLPPGGACQADDDCPADPDPCRRSACAAEGCIAQPLAGLDGVSCVCRKPLPAACPAELPRRIARPLARACAAIARADGARAKKQARLAVRMARLLARARTATRRAAKDAPSMACVEALDTLFADGVTRAQSFADAAPRE
jgi:hypothetical protein